MQKVYLNTGSLSVKNLQARPVRTFCLVLVVAILSFTLFSGSIIIFNLRQGLATITKRFGADLMVVPEGSYERAETLLLRGEPDFFYFDAGIIDIVKQTEGVVQASPQFYLISLADSDCCDAEMQLIAYDPATDFVVQPWIAEKYSEKISDGQIVTGSRISIRYNGTVQLFNHEFPVAAQLSRSASGFDTSIFMTMNTMHQLVGYAKNVDNDFPSESFNESVISSILVKTDSSASPSYVAWEIENQNDGVEVVVAQGVFGQIASALSGFVKYIQFFLIALWVLAIFVLAIVFSGIIHERKKEFALLRIVGSTRKKLVGIVLCESSLAGLAGGIAGITLASLVVFPFAGYIGARLDLPYIDSPLPVILLIAFTCLFVSVLSGPLASLYTALRISKAETYFTMREGE